MPKLPAVRILPLVLIAVSTLAASDAMAQRGSAGATAVSVHADNDDRAGRGAARPDNDRTERRGQDRSADHRELSAAVRRVESRTGGQVLSAERIPFDGRDVSRIKVVDASGRVRVYMDDPQAAGGRRGNPPAPPPTRDDDN